MSEKERPQPTVSIARCILLNDSDLAIDLPLTTLPVLSTKNHIGQPFKTKDE